VTDITVALNMRLDLNPIRTATSLGPTAGSLLSNWRVGAIVEAVAIRDITGQLWLRIGNTHYPARVASGPAEGPANGEVLQARVLRTSPVLALETLQTTDANGADDVTSSALLRYAPRQSSPAALAANLAFLARSQGDQAFPAPVQQAIRQLWQALPNAAELTDPEQLQRALEQSGAFLESRLARGQAPTGDLKALLLTLQAALTSAGARASAAQPNSPDGTALPNLQGAMSHLPSAPATLALLDSTTAQLHELARQTEGVLARLTTTQIQNATQSAAMPAVMIELPVRVDDRAAMLRLRIEREASRHGGDEADSIWTVEAALDLGAHGGLHARISLSGTRLSVQLRADSPYVVEQLATRSPELEALLRESGLSIDRIVCLHGMPAAFTGQPMHRLLDVRA
jgi:hypothetical protein